MRNFFRVLSLSAFALLSAGCAKQEPMASAGVVELAGTGGLPAPSAGDFRQGGQAFLMGPLDKVRIDVFGVGELSREIQVDSSGQFDFPLVGTIDAAGRTPRNVAQEIERKLEAAYVRDPDVTINLLETVSQRVTVEGEVTVPGLYPVTTGTTLLRSIAMAEGLDEFADKEDVVVFRTVDGQRYAALYNLAAIRRGNYEDPQIFANDVIVVGDSKSLRLFDNLFRAAPLITTPLLILLRN